MYAQVLVDVENQAVDQIFDYMIPTSLRPVIMVGQRVIIPFGARKITGFVVGLSDQTELKTLKPIIDIKDLTPYFDAQDLALSELLSKRYFHPRISYLNAMLPSGLSMRYQTTYRVLKKEKLDEKLKPLFEDQEIIKESVVPKTHKYALKKALENNWIESEQSIKQATKIKTTPIITLEDQTYNPPKNAHKQHALIEALKNRPKGLMLKELTRHLKITHATLKPLIDKGVIRKEHQETRRIMMNYYQEADKNITLNSAQQSCFEAVNNRLNEANTFLLHGVISSGKTELYIKWLKAILKQGKNGLLLLPEIALTPKIIARIKAAIDVPIAQYHSAMSTGEQYDEWRRIKQGEVRIVIGARSAIFTPLKNVGIIIIDEAQSDAYIQTEQAEYDTIFIAKIKSKQYACPLILGSATPSIKDYYLATEKKEYIYLPLKTRALKSPKPHIHLIDMKQEFKANNPSIFSKALQEAIEKRLKHKQQVLILINRRGHARFVLCRDCAHRIKCEACDISLTYHQEGNLLKCHHCNYERPMPKRCPACDSKNIRYMGIGSQRVEAEIKSHFPKANVFRLDKDTSQTKGAHERLLYDFEHQGDILIGTQMIAKGLDFDNVTLVSVLSADMSLFVPDFYAESETFMLLFQMAGRSGRRSETGDVIIQAYDIEHPVLSFVEAQDYDAFYQREIAFRKQAKVEPFYELIQITTSHKRYDEAYKKALKIKQQLNNLDHLTIMGPTDAKIKRRMHRYRIQLLIRHQDHPTLHQHLKAIQKASKSDVTITKHPRLF